MAVCLGGANSVWGQKSNLTTDKGWSLMTAIPADPNLYFFAIYDHSQDLGLVLDNGTSDKQGESNKAMLYASSVNPENDKNALWTIAKNGDDIVITCANYPEYMFQTEYQAYEKYHTSDNGGSYLFWGSLIPAYDAGAGWTFVNRHANDDSQVDKYLGPWDGAVVAGDQIAANKSTTNLGHFDIYMIERGRYFKNVAGQAADANTVDASYLITNANATRRNIVGWEGAGFYVRDDQKGWSNGDYCFAIHDDSNPIPNCTFYQTISNLPAGRYTMTVTLPDWANFHSGPSLHANTSDVSITKEENNLISNTFDHPGGNLEYGIKIESSSEKLTFFPFDNFTLTAHYLSDYATAMSLGSTNMTKDIWYKYTASVSGTYNFSSTTLSDIIYTDINQIPGAEISQNALNSSVDLTAGTTYYFKSASDQTISISSPVVSATIGSTGYATFSSTYPVNVDVAGLEAYIATGKNGDYITMEQVTGDIAANTGLVLKGDVGTYSLPVVASGNTQSDNLLQPCDGSWTTLKKSDDGTNYVLSEQGDPKAAVFAPIGETAATLRAGVAYLYISGVSSSSRALRFSFSDNTGVENVKVAEATVKKNGAYLENGKIAIYKNGLKFNAAGQQMK